MPFALEYDGDGNVVGGHVVDKLQSNPLLSTPYHGPLPNLLYGHHTSPSKLFQEHEFSAPSLLHTQYHHRHDYPPSSLLHTQQQDSYFTPTHQALMRSPAPAQTNGGTFLNSFSKHFAHDPDTLLAFEALFTNYNKKVIDETEFYTGTYMLLARTDSQHLVPGLMKVLPASWQESDLTWLHQAAEALYEEKAKGKHSSSNVVEKASTDTFESAVVDMKEHDSSDAVEHIMSEPGEQGPPLSSDTQPSHRRVKRTPANGFRTSYATTTSQARSMFIDPAALLIHKPVIDEMPESDEGPDTWMLDELPSREGLVKLKLTPKSRAAKSETTSSRRVLQMRAAKRTKAKGSLLKEITAVDDHMEEPSTSVKSEEEARDTSVSETTPQAGLTRKGRNRYGDMYAAEIDHFGHFPTRRAVIARASRPYVHLSCGKGFSHPMDVKDHHRNKERVKSGAGCTGKDGIPQGDDDTWDAHLSARVEYPDLNYTKVKDGYVLLDQESRDMIDNAVTAGLKYLAEQERDDIGSSSDGDEEMEAKMFEAKTTKEETNIENEKEQASIRSAGLGLREGSTRSSTYGA